MLESLRNKKILFVVAHPDDELLGVGGTINKLISEYNSDIKVVILGEGITSRSLNRDLDQWKEDLKVHKSNIHDAKSAIGYQELSIYDFPDNRFDTVALLDLIKVVEKEKNSFAPSIVFTHHGGDVNIDHQKTFEAVITACRPIKEEAVETIITFETPSGTEWRSSTDPKHFVPNFFVEINESNLEAKIKGMESYEFESRQYPHPRSPKALRILAMQRGVMIGCEFAEAFSIIRTIGK
jgi:LmbE family N-acetylglucosaminyl deacetylase